MQKKDEKILQFRANAMKMYVYCTLKALLGLGQYLKKKRMTKCFAFWYKKNIKKKPSSNYPNILVVFELIRCLFVKILGTKNWRCKTFIQDWIQMKQKHKYKANKYPFLQHSVSVHCGTVSKLVGKKWKNK